MTTTPHDTFAKNYLKELLSPLGEVRISQEISDEPNEIDVLFLPSSTPNISPESIGLLSKLAFQTSVIEVFRNQPNPFQARNCLKNLYIYFSELNREVRRNGTSLDEAALGKVWIISTTASQNFLDGFGAKLDPDSNCTGVYSLHESLKASIIAVNQLPTTDETLWLRILGKGRVQHQAVDEFLALPDTSPYKHSTLKMLANLRIVTLKQTNLTEEDQETVMNLSTAYLEWEQKTLEQGEQRGEQRGELKGEQKVIIRQLNRRLGEIQPSLIEGIHKLSVEQLEELAEALLDFYTVANLENWLNQLLTH
jgi:hypothetical protein